MMASLSDELLIEFSAADRRAAADFCVAHIEAGMTLSEVVDDAIAPAMAQVGGLWQSAVWSVADEHIATGVAETALSAAAVFHRPPPSRGDVLVACVEGDWHSLASRMAAEVLDSEGWSVRFGGASQPTSALTDYVRRHHPNAVLLTCMIPSGLPALLDAVDQLHRLATPVFVGGRALGVTPRRAAAIGADGWAPNATLAARLLDQPPAPALPATALGRLPEYRVAREQIPAWAARAMSELAPDLPVAELPGDAALSDLAALPGDVRERTRSDLTDILDTAAVAALLDDETLIVDQVHWLADVLGARGVSADALPNELSALCATKPLDEASPKIMAMLTVARDAVSLRTTPLRTTRRSSASA